MYVLTKKSSILRFLDGYTNLCTSLSCTVSIWSSIVPSPLLLLPSLLPLPPSEANSSRFSTLEMKPPNHLQKEADDHVLESFFGVEQVDKLNKFKKSISVENPTADNESGESNKKLVRPKIPVNPNPGYGSGPSSRPGSGKGSKSNSPLLPSPAVNIPRLQHPKKEPVSDVVSEMQKLRLRLQETTRQELAEIDRQFSPKLSRLELIGSNKTGQGSHSRQGSLDSSSQPAPQPVSMGHVRHVSLPVDPIVLVNDSRPRTSSTSPSPLVSSDASEKLKSHSDTHSHSLERSRSPNSRSPTPPFQYGHIRQGSVGSASSGSIGFSPPPTSGLTSPTGLMSPTRYQFPPPPTQRQQQSSPEIQQGSGRTISPRPFATPPPSRTHQVQRQQPQHYSYKQPHSMTTGKPPVPTPLHKGYNGGTSAPQLTPSVNQPQQSHHRKTSGSHTTGRIPRDGESQQSSDHHTSTGGRMRPGSGGKTHYSTAVVRGRRHSGDSGKLPQARSVDDVSKHLKEQPQVVRNGYPQTSADSPAYDRLLPASGERRGTSSSPTDLDQSEQKRVSKTPYRMALPPGSKSDTHRSPSPRQLPRGETLPNFTQNSNSYARLEPKVSAPNLFDNKLKENNATVFPEEIQPYSTSGALRSQMQPFVYTPFTQQERRHGTVGSTSNSSSTGSKLDKHKPLKPTEQTWC